MKNRQRRAANISKSASSAGFSLVELMVAMAIFLVIGGAAVELAKKHVPLFTAQQSQTGLNLAMRNGVAQMQIDVVNAGTGYYQGVNIPSWPIGITILNSTPGANCFDAATNTYTSTCFDTLNVIAIDQTPPSHPFDVGGTDCIYTDDATTLFVTPTGTTTLSQLAADFHTGDQILLVKSDGSQMTTTILTSDGMVSGGKVHLAHNPTGLDGTNKAKDDPLGLTTTDNNKLGRQYCTADWVLKLAPITYSVDASDPTDPKLIRTQGGQPSVIAEQIIGFKVGASIWNGTTDNTYSFDASTYTYDWSLIRSVRVSMIGRTPTDLGSSFRNSFDGGPYKIQSISVVINPRNLSMND